MWVNVFLLSARHIGIIFHIGPMPIFTFKAIIGRFRYQSEYRASLVFAYDFCFASAVLHGCVMTSRHSVWIILKICLFFAVFSIDYNDELDTLVSGSADLTVKVWSLSSGTCVNTLTGHTEWVTKVRLLTSVHCTMLWLGMGDILSFAIYQ